MTSATPTPRPARHRGRAEATADPATFDADRSTAWMAELAEALEALSEGTGTSPRELLRFWMKVDASGDCWEWTGAKTNHGYGRLKTNGTFVLAHRYVYTLLIGEIPPRLVVDHMCRNHGCVNPTHLRVATHRENTLAGYSPPANRARQTHCHTGHPLSGANLRITSDGSRRCRACDRLREQKRDRHGRAA